MSASSSLPLRSLALLFLVLAGCATRGGTEDTTSPVNEVPLPDGSAALPDAAPPTPDAQVHAPTPDASEPLQDAAPTDVGDAAVMDAQVDVPPLPDASTEADAAVDVPVDPSLPVFHDHTASSPAHVLSLVRRALSGLGFDPAGKEGPGPHDRVFIGRRYLAWIDQTGFYGKINALFTLNGAEGDALEFVLKDPDGRPINLFVPGEDGDGAWASSYKGSEHIEFPNRVPEANDSQSCGQGDWCNQYSLNEAPPITNSKIPWWSACNQGSIDYGTKFEPILLEESEDRLKIVYEGRLVKEADGDGTPDGDACHADYLFPDKVRRQVWLQVGYELFANQNYFDRTLRIRNPAGNPEFVGAMSLIGGYVFTQWPLPHYQKRLQRFWRPENNDITLAWGDSSVPLLARTWNDLTSYKPLEKDVLISWAKQPITLSTAAGERVGSTITLSHIGPDADDNEDVGACLCAVHGGIELGGGLIHGDKVPAVPGGGETQEAKRRLTIPSTGSGVGVTSFAYEAESQLGHQVGRTEAEGWSANTGGDVAGHMVHGPYANNWGAGAGQAVFVMMVDDNDYDNEPVVTLEAYDATAGAVIASQPVRRREFKKRGTYQRVALNFDLEGRDGHSMEVRVWWHDISYVRIDKVVVNLAAKP
jgi:hypothetical protein